MISLAYKYIGEADMGPAPVRELRPKLRDDASGKQLDSLVLGDCKSAEDVQLLYCFVQA